MIFKRYVLEVLCASLLPGVDVLSVGGTTAEFLCAGLASPRSLRPRAPKASLSRALILLLLLSLVLATFSTLGLVLSPARSPLWFLRCSLRRLRAPIRSSADEFGKWRNNKISRIAVRRRCDVSASGFRGGASWSWPWEAEESWESTGRRSTRLRSVSGLDTANNKIGG